MTTTTPAPLARLLRPAEVADLLGVDARTLADWRTNGNGPSYVRIGPARRGTVRYREDAVAAWLNARTVTTREVEAIAAQAPPLTADQADALGAIFRGSAR